MQLERINTYYHEDRQGYIPRAILVDLEPTVVGSVLAGPLGLMFTRNNIVTGIYINSLLMVNYMHAYVTIAIILK